MSDKPPIDFTIKLELVPVPVTDVDRALNFYVNDIGFNLDHDYSFPGGVRIAQLTPPGSGCSILLSTGLPDIQDMVPGSLRGLHLVVDDAHLVHDVMQARGVAMSDVDDMGGVFYVWFADPDGNTWTFQEITANTRRPETV